MAMDNVKTFGQADTWFYIEKDKAKKASGYDDKKPTQGMKDAIEKMVKLATNESEADDAHGKAKKHGHYESEAYDKLCEMKNKPGVFQKVKGLFS